MAGTGKRFSGYQLADRLGLQRELSGVIGQQIGQVGRVRPHGRSDEDDLLRCGWRHDGRPRRGESLQLAQRDLLRDSDSTGVRPRQVDGCAQRQAMTR